MCLHGCLSRWLKWAFQLRIDLLSMRIVVVVAVVENFFFHLIHSPTGLLCQFQAFILVTHSSWMKEIKIFSNIWLRISTRQDNWKLEKIHLFHNTYSILYSSAELQGHPTKLGNNKLANGSHLHIWDDCKIIPLLKIGLFQNPWKNLNQSWHNSFLKNACFYPIAFGND